MTRANCSAADLAGAGIHSVLVASAATVSASAAHSSGNVQTYRQTRGPRSQRAEIKRDACTISNVGPHSCGGLDDDGEIDPM